MKCFYNYIYLDTSKPSNFKIDEFDLVLKFQPFYIGKGKDKRKLLCTKRNSSNKHLSNKISKLIKSGKPPMVIQINENLSENKALENEKYLIKKFGIISEGGILVNLTYGGGGASGYKHTNKTKNKISKSLKGRKLSSKTKKKISNSISGENHHMYGKKISKTHKEKLISSIKGKKQSIEHIKKCAESKCKSVRQIDLTTKEIVNTFNSAKEAMQQTGINKISAVCRKKRNKAGGYYWEYI